MFVCLSVHLLMDEWFNVRRSAMHSERWARDMHILCRVPSRVFNMPACSTVSVIVWIVDMYFSAFWRCLLVCMQRCSCGDVGADLMTRCQSVFYCFSVNFDLCVRCFLAIDSVDCWVHEVYNSICCCTSVCPSLVRWLWICRYPLVPSSNGVGIVPLVSVFSNLYSLVTL